MKKILAAALAFCMIFSFCAVSASAEDVTEITFWSLFTGDDGAIMQGIIDKFNEENPDIFINHIPMQASTDLNVKLPLVAGNDEQAPDLAVIQNYNIPVFASQGALQPISIVTDGVEALNEELFLSPDAVRYNGDRYGILIDFPATLIYANKTLIDKYYPEIDDDNIITWDEVFELGDKIAAAGDIEDVKPFVSSDTKDDIYQDLITADNLFSTDGVTFTKTPEEIQTGIENWVKLYNMGYTMEEDGDALGMLALGQTVMATGGTWNLSAVKTYGIDFEMLPGVQRSADGEIRTECGGHTFVLPQRTLTPEKIEALGRFLSWFEENVQMWAESGAVVAYKPVNESEAFAQLPQAQVVEPGTRFYAHTFMYTNICGQVINTYGFQPVYGHMTPEDWANTVVTEITSLIAAQQG